MDGVGCTSSVYSLDMSKTAPSATITVNNVSCYNGSNGSIVVTSPTGGNSGQYTVSINGSTYYTFTSNSYSFTGLSSGSYTIYVKDYLGCVAQYPQTITQPTQQTVGLSVVTSPTCNGSTANSDGVMQVTSSGGVFPKTYRLYADTSSPYSDCFGGTLVNTWTNVTSGAATFNVSGLTYYGYCLEVTDANGCVTRSGIVELPVVINATFSQSSTGVSGSGNGSSTGVNSTITVTCGSVTVRLTTSIQTGGGSGSSSITVPGYGTYSTSNATLGSNAFVDFTLGPGTYNCTNFIANVSGGGSFTVVSATLTKV
jgi:hypothetical protein